MPILAPLLANWRLILSAALIVGAGYMGWHERSIRDQADIAAAQAQVLVQVGKSEIVTENIAATAQLEQVQIQAVTTAIIKEVRAYVTVKADAACAVPRGFVELLNAAASGVPPVPNATWQPDDPSGVAISTVAGSVSGNYGICHAEIARLTQLQDWVRTEATVK